MPTLNSWDLLISKFCTSYLSWTTTCDRWDTYVSSSYLSVAETSLTSSIMYAGIILIVISMVLYVLKTIFTSLFKK